MTFVAVIGSNQSERSILLLLPRPPEVPARPEVTPQTQEVPARPEVTPQTLEVTARPEVKKWYPSIALLHNEITGLYICV